MLLVFTSGTVPQKIDEVSIYGSTSPERNRDTMIKQVKEVVENKARVFEVKSASPLLNLRCFNIIDEFCPDYIHCYLAGVGEQLTEFVLKYLTLNDVNQTASNTEIIEIHSLTC